MKVFYNPNMSTPSHGYSPSGSKPAAAVADWQAHNLDIEIVDFEPATESDLCLAHDPKFVRGVMSRKMTNGHGNRLKSVTDSCLWTVGSIVAASRAALTDGITCSPTSGFHHAGYNYNGAFCTYNGLIVAARKLIDEGLVSRVGIVDCDAHYGDGTQDIIEKLDLGDVIKHWTFGAEFGGRRKDFNSDDLLKQLGYALAAMRIDGVELIHAMNQYSGELHSIDIGSYSLNLELQNNLQPGTYNLTFGIHRPDGRTLEYVENCLSIEVLSIASDDSTGHKFDFKLGYVRASSDWKLQKI